MVERTSRFVILAKLEAPTADAAAQAITREMSRMAPSLLMAITHDQGSEMARHAEIAAQTGMKITLQIRTAHGNAAAMKTPMACCVSICQKGLISP